MSNEDKILTILEQIQSEQKQTNQRLGKLEAGQSKLEAGQAKLEAGQANLEESVDRLHGSVAFIENDHGKKLGALLDGYSMLSENMRDIKPIVEKTALDVAIVTASVSVHTDKFTALKAAI